MSFRCFLPLFLLFPALPARGQTPNSAPIPSGGQTFRLADDEAESGGYDVTAQIESFPAEFLLAQCENGNAYNLKIGGKSLQLWKIRGKKSVLLTQSPLGALKFPIPLAAQRRGAHWRVLLNYQTVLEAEDDAYSEGKIGSRGGAKDVRVQPIETIQFDDDFMRVASEIALKDALQNPRAGVKINSLQTIETAWNTLSGQFATTGLTENADAMVAQSLNPFAFRALKTGENLALSGRPFWSDYAANVSVQPQGASEIGLLAYAQDAKNYLGLFWGEKNGPQLRAVLDGKTKILDSAADFGPFEKNQWFRLRLEVAGGQLRGFIDDTEVVRARTGSFGRGQVGLWARLPREGDDKKGEGVVFDDVSVRSLTDFYDDFSRAVPGRWTTIAGTWNWNRLATPTDARGAYAVMGQSHWTNYHVAAELQVPADGAAGLLLHHSAGKGAYLLRVTGSKSKTAGAGRVQIVRIEKGKTQVLGEKIVKSRYDGSRSPWELSDERGYLCARLGDELIVDAFDTALGSGRAGIYAQNGKSAAQASDFAVRWPQNPSKWAKVPDLFEIEQQAQTMGGWSTPQGFWVARKSNDKPNGKPNDKTAPQNAVWHKGEFFGEEDVKFPLPDLSGDKKLQLFFAQKNAGQNAPLALTFTQKGAFKAELSAANHLFEGQADLKTGDIIEIARRGSYFIVRSGEKVVLAAQVG